MPDRKDRQRVLFGLTVIGYGIMAHELIFVSRVTGQDQDMAEPMKLAGGRADPKENYGSEDVGQKKMKEVQTGITRVMNETATKGAALLTVTGIMIINN
jgi:hypothetical protein